MSFRPSTSLLVLALLAGCATPGTDGVSFGLSPSGTLGASATTPIGATGGQAGGATSPVASGTA
ncbi:MAG TPA: hypothetical protein V6D47_19825, partial [Oscillatoriaceae cyanobacterium]